MEEVGGTVCEGKSVSDNTKDSLSDTCEFDELYCFGIDAIDQACLQIYPDQENPIQAEAVVKYW